MANIENAKEIADVARNLEKAKKDLKTHQGFLESDLKANRDPAIHAIDVKYDTQRIQSLQNELDKLT